MELCWDKLHMTVETTGGYDSTSNGKVETNHRPSKSTARKMLMTANLSSKFICLADQYSGIIHKRDNKKIPEVHFGGSTAF
jgi:hypothetical protein